MDVKSVFFNGFLVEEVYVSQPTDFINEKKFNHIFKLTETLYSLKQSRRAWFGRLSTFPNENGFFR